MSGTTHVTEPPTRRVRFVAPRVLLAAAYAAYVVVMFARRGSGGGWDWRFDGVLANVVLVGSGLLVLLGIRRDDPARGPMRLLGVAATTWALGNVYWSVKIQPLDPAPFPSIADWLWLAFYPLTAVALVLIARTRVRRLDVGLLLDGVIGGCAMAAAASAFVFDRIVSATHGDQMTVVVNLAYPVGDLLLVVLVVATGIVSGRRDRRWWLLLAGLGVFAVGDSVYLAQVASDTYNGGVIDLTWVSALFALSFTSLKPRAATGRPRTRVALALPVAFSTVSLVLIATHEGLNTSDLSFYLAIGALTASVPRLLLAGRDVHRLVGVHAEARTDELTGLPNRRAFYEQVGAALAEPTAGQTALMVLDLNGFKQINDTAGHHGGDEALAIVARALRTAVRDGDQLARLGGDEFAVIAKVASGDEAMALAARIDAELRSTIVVRGRSYDVSSSIGVALADHDLDADDLLARADEAMYAAKRRHGPPVRYRHRSVDVPFAAVPPAPSDAVFVLDDRVAESTPVA